MNKKVRIKVKQNAEYSFFVKEKSKGILNNTKDYIVAKLEDSVEVFYEGEKKKMSFLIMKPNENLPACCDGAILKNAVIVKVSAKKPDKVCFSVEETEDGNIKLLVTDMSSARVNIVSDIGKKIYNISPNNCYDLSGIYLNQDKENAVLNKWWSDAINEAETGLPEQWKSNYYESEWQKALRNKFSETDS